MSRSRPVRLLLSAALTLAAMVGCGKPAPPITDTGAREVVRNYYEALVARDWPRAYSGLHPDVRRAVTPAAFARWAEGYHRGLGFAAQEVHLRSCDEQGDRAVAHVVLSGAAQHRRRQYRDGVTLRRVADGWYVDPPAGLSRR
ncbi:MAG: nuclear transport factor 2 family protein [Gemmataceae bacterium]